MKQIFLFHSFIRESKVFPLCGSLDEHVKLRFLLKSSWVRSEPRISSESLPLSHFGGWGGEDVWSFGGGIWKSLNLSVTWRKFNILLTLEQQSFELHRSTCMWILFNKYILWYYMVCCLAESENAEPWIQRVMCGFLTT